MIVDSVRTFREDDVEGIRRVFRSWWAGEHKEILELLESRYFDSNGLLVAEENSEIVGFAYAYVDVRIVSRLGRSLGFLAGIFKLPDVSEGVDRRLLEKSLQYLKELKAVEVEVPDYHGSLGNGVTAEKDSNLYRLYEEAGFKICMHSYDMSRSLKNLAVPRWVSNRCETLLDDGFSLRKARKDDAPALVEVHEEAFKESYGHIPRTEDDIEQAIDEIVKEIDLHLENTMLLEKDRRIVGFSDFSTEKYGKILIGYPCVAVLPDYRNKGLGTVLFWDCLERLKKSGVSMAGVTVIGTNYPAVHMYRKAGFTIDNIWYHLRKTI